MGLVTRAARRIRSQRQAPALFLLSLGANLLTFALSIAAAHLLDAGSYGQVMGLFGVFGAVALPTTVIQILVARHLAHASRPAVVPIAGLARRPVAGAVARPEAGPVAGPVAGPGAETVAPPTEPQAEAHLTTGFVKQVRQRLPQVVALVGIALLVLAAIAATTLRLPRVSLLTVVALAWFAGSSLAWWRGRAHGARHFTTLGAALLLESGVRLVVFVALVQRFRVPADWAFAGATAASFTAAGALLSARAGTDDAPPLALAPVLRAARAALLVAVAGGVLSALDLVWARAVLPTVDAGHFAAGTLASRPYLLVAAVAGTLALPYAARGALSLARLLRAAWLLALAGSAGALLLWPLAPTLANLLYPPSYAEAAATIRYAALGSAWLAPALFVANATLGFRRPLGQTTLAILTAVLVAGTFLGARSPAMFWLLCGVAGALHLLILTAAGRRRQPA